MLAVGEHSSELAGAFLVLERVPGRPLKDLLFGPSLARAPGWLAEAQARLHQLDAAELERALAQVGCAGAPLHLDDELAQDAAVIERTGLEGLREAHGWLAAHRPNDAGVRVICHGDFHPLNVMVDRGNVSGVIDWTRVRVAEPAYDVGATVAITRQGPLALPAWLDPLLRAGRRMLLAAYLSDYRRRRPLDPQRVRYYEALRSLGFLIEAGQHRMAELGKLERPSKATAFAAPRVQAAVASRFHALTGVLPELP